MSKNSRMRPMRVLTLVVVVLAALVAIEGASAVTIDPMLGKAVVKALNASKLSESSQPTRAVYVRCAGTNAEFDRNLAWRGASRAQINGIIAYALGGQSVFMRPFDCALARSMVNRMKNGTTAQAPLGSRRLLDTDPRGTAHAGRQEREHDRVPRERHRPLGRERRLRSPSNRGEPALADGLRPLREVDRVELLQRLRLLPGEA